ncbi:hypothetical protein K432DRAFT_445684 [Lepidopterella palustris CBS 459.81]|uniref:AB hydrolase-1 domain-containing protein n=1 Tax=Lepidopterella palustris CBS 459.81 TaxID=1314670 RepID=A0A8E2E3X0_9PEZI|nr:hypothetical protein K432DRAFT_445684 [Lepidopterella palustris CBS 459.81]
MIGTSTPEYVFIRACIAGLRAITPLSILYFGFCVFYHPRSLLTSPLAAYAAIETAFYLVVYLPRTHYLQTPAQHPAAPGRERRQLLFRQCCSTITNPEGYLRKWFLGSESAEIKRENVKEFFRWAFLNSVEFDSADDEELEEYVRDIEDLLGRKIEPGRGRAKCLRLTIDKADMMQRSFSWYMCVGFVDTLSAIHMKFRGFSFYRIPLSRFFTVFPFRPFTLFSSHQSPATHLSYWYRPHTSKTHLPVLFIHGIGIGLYPYVGFLAMINEKDEFKDWDGDIGIIAVEVMPISFRITSPALAKAEMCSQINSILEAHGWDEFVLASHSYGTVISTHLLQSPEIGPKIGPMVLIDPVTFLLHLPHVAFNFTMRKPRSANEHQLYYFASKDMGVAHTLSRRFFWSENILWKEDIADRNVTVSLGGRDLIVDTEVVGRYLVGADTGNWKDGSWKEGPWIGDGLDVLWFQQCDHAQVFDEKKTRKKLVDVVQRYCRNGRRFIEVAPMVDVR